MYLHTDVDFVGVFAVILRNVAQKSPSVMLANIATILDLLPIITNQH